MGIFVPYNLKIVRDKEDTPAQMEFYISVILETPVDGRDQLIDMVVQDVTFQPAQTPFKQMGLAVVMNSDNEPKMSFHSFDPRQDSIERVL